MAQKTPRTINDEIQNMINNTLNQQMPIQEITIHNIHDDNSHVDVELQDGSILEYLPCIANSLATGHHGLLIPLENDRFYVITK